MDKIPMTPAGFKSADNELKQLKSVDRPSVIKAIAEAREHGDLSENAEYHSARELQSHIEGRIKELEAIIFYYFKKKFESSNFLNTEKQVSNKVFRDKYKVFWQ